MWFLLLATILSVSPANCAANVTELDFLGEMPVVLSVSRLRQPTSEAPSATSVIDREMIRASGFREVADLFRLVPGFYVGHVSGNHPVVSYHGLTGEYSPRLQVLIDGRSVYSQLFGGAEWSDIALSIDDIERIEIVRGPNAASFGSNAFFGVINIITRHPAEEKGSFASLTIGEKGLREGTLRTSLHSGALSARATFNYLGNNGFDDRYDDIRRRFVNVRGDYQLNNTDNIDFQFGATRGARQRGFADCALTFDCERTQKINANFLQMRWQRKFDTSSELSVQVFHEYHSAREMGTEPIAQIGGPPQLFAIDNHNITQRSDFEIQHIIAPHSDWRVVWGGGARRDSVYAPLLFSRSDSIITNLNRLFAHAEWRPTSQWLFSAGAMLEDNSLTGFDTSPRVALHYMPTPSHSIRMSASRATRIPTTFTEYANFHFDFGTIQLQPFFSSGGVRAETILSREVGYVGNFFDQRLNLDLRIFHEKLGDLTTAVAVPFGNAINGSTTDFTNANNATVKGFEAQLNFRPDTYSRVLLSYGRTSVSSNSPVLENTPPRNTIGGLITRALSNDWSTSVGYYQTSARSPNELQPFNQASNIPLARRLDLRLAKAMKAAWGRGEFSVVVQNILDPYVDYSVVNKFDRRAFVQIQLNF